MSVQDSEGGSSCAGQIAHSPGQFRVYTAVAGTGTTGMDVATIGVMKRTATESTTPRNTPTTASALRVARPRAAKSTKAPEAPATLLSDSDIATRAYEIFKARNGEPGDPISDWLQAERELRTVN